MNKKTAKVLLVSEYFLPHWTGISQAFYYLAKNLQEQGYEVKVLTTQYDSALPIKETLKKIAVVRAPYLLRISRTHYSIAILLKFVQMLPAYDWVVINSPNSNILFLTLLAKVLGKKVALYHQGDLTLPRQTGNAFVHTLLEFVFDLLSGPSFILADITSTYTRDYAAHSRVMKHALRTFRPYIPGFKAAKGAPSKSFVQTLTHIKKNHILIGIAGRFVEEKGYELLLQAIPEIKKAFPKAHIVFAGKHLIDYEPYFAYHEKLIKKHKKDITFLGLLDSGDLSYFYDSLDIFVISSRSDCFPVTQIEAVHHGIPLVVTDIPGARMLVKDSGFGAIAKPEDPKDLARAIIKVLKERKTYLTFHKKALQFLHDYAIFKLD